MGCPPKLIVFIGIAGSGKTTYRKNMMKNIEIICPDEIRLNYFNVVFDESIESQVWEIIFSKIESCLHRGFDCLIDGTNLTEGRRGRYVKLARDFGAHLHAVVFDVPFGIVAKRNLNRGAVVPDDVMKRMKANWERLDVPFGVLSKLSGEGFDKIDIIENYIMVRNGT